MTIASPESITRPIDEMVTEGFRETCDKVIANGGLVHQMQDRLFQLCEISQRQYDIEMVRDLMVYLVIIKGVFIGAVVREIRLHDVIFSDLVAKEAAQRKAVVADGDKVAAA
ncbi:MAG: hypothetical protein WAV04_01555 [Candidatus Microsaccharimonas sp.]